MLRHVYVNPVHFFHAYVLDLNKETPLTHLHNQHACSVVATQLKYHVRAEYKRTNRSAEEYLQMRRYYPTRLC